MGQNQLQLVQPSCEDQDDAMKKVLLVARTDYVKVANLKEYDQKLK